MGDLGGVLLQLLGDWGDFGIWYQAKSHEIVEIGTYSLKRHDARICMDESASGFASEVDIFLIGKIHTFGKYRIQVSAETTSGEIVSIG